MVDIMRIFRKKFFTDIFNKLIGKEKKLKIGFYGHPNSGKTTLANRMTKDWLGKPLGLVSEIPHETRRVYRQERVSLNYDGVELDFDIIDTPGIATKIDYKNFLQYGLSELEAKERAKEATKGIIEAIKWLDDVTGVLLVVDSTKDPLTQANITIIGNLEARKIPFVIVANKVDLPESKPERITSVFPQHKVVSISALHGENTDKLYQAMVEKFN
ncbi:MULTISPECIES: Era-like GTP-binding protein [Methanobacterium]|jgi:small GTP-binding protein|uniref:GTP-binding protein n=1 Tax=Methanobacterium formicicum TaxID=2162 RepID=A0A090I1C1_METFO|nr:MULTISPECIES: Era-like GTP-binding protein [Methanobacterium]AIS31271.1 GTP-binding protein [Methanobacterium formicicum]AXV40966.1 MAG: GTP-binding protein [Methanobacterium sp. BAmetb5]KUK72982.1 MAG: GTP-binding protein HSR1-like protein [Methanobacterium sp. 42_16]MBF4474391.1 GTP-binding protein [Methanobacterium formicicum]MDD4810545.1 Era-like GTP-binding protein [Methanobacterium formicicum]